MSHLSELELNALLDAQAQSTSEHLSQCTRCQAQLAALDQERQLITTVMAADAEEFATSVVIPKFSPPASLTRFALFNLSTALVIWLGQFLWKTIFGELIMNALTTVTSVYVPDLYAAANASFLYYLQEGTTMLDAYLELIVFTVCLLTMAWLLLHYRRSRTVISMGVLIAFGGTLAAPTPASALDLRYEDEGVITLKADETVNDTLLIAADTILIRGDIDGDLIAAGRRIEVDGAVSGNLIAFAEEVTLHGSVGGSVMTAASSVELGTVQIKGDLWAAGNRVSVDREASITRNSLTAAETLVFEGKTTKALYAFAETVEFDGELGGQLNAYGRRIRLLDAAIVKGAAQLHLPSADLLQRSASAQLLGGLDLQENDEHVDDSNRYTRGTFYLWQAARLISALLVGLALLWYLPQYKTLRLGGGGEGFKTAGFGLFALIGAPIAALLVAFTLIGIPLSFITITAWVLLIYLAKIVVGAYIGRSILASTEFSDNNLGILLAGLAIIIVAVNIPMIGSIINFLLTVVGMGLIVQHLIGAYATPSTTQQFEDS